MKRKYKEWCIKYCNKIHAWSETANLKKVHRILFAFLATIFALLFGLSVIYQMHIDSPAAKVEYRENIQDVKLSPGEYRVCGINYSDSQNPLLLVTGLHGGVLMAVQPPKTITLPNVVISYKLKISNQGEWSLYQENEKDFYKDVHNGHLEEQTL